MPDGGVAVAIASCVAVALLTSTGAGATCGSVLRSRWTFCDGVYIPSDSEPDGVGLDDGLDPPDPHAARSRATAVAVVRRAAARRVTSRP